MRRINSIFKNFNSSINSKTSLPSINLTLSLIWLTILSGLTVSYQVLISDTDDVRQVCSGMWQKFAKSREPYIEIFFGPASKGHLALVIYEWRDARYLGIDSTNQSNQNTWASNRTYICTLEAVARSLCQRESLGEFIVSGLPENQTSIDQTSIWTKSVRLETTRSKLNISSSSSSDLRIGGKDQGLVIGPWRYNVSKTGYYCVGAVPLTVSVIANDTTSFSSYTGVVAFENVFEGDLPAGEYPKVAFFGFVTVVYVIVGILWGINCYRHRTEILPVQHYISASIIFLVIELATNSGYYNFRNQFGNSNSFTKVLLVTVSILSAARNAISFFMLLIVSLGYSIVKESLGSVMLKVRLLTVAHFLFGVVYGLGISIFPFESAGLWIFLMVFPLAFTLTGFMMWIMAALSHTIQTLESKRQTYKKQMFVRLNRILMAAALVIVIFFFVSSISFSNRLSQDFAPDTWSTRWFILDGWLSLLYMVCFVSIAYLWRPTERNRYLAMSDELVQNEDEADEFDDRRNNLSDLRGGHLNDEDDDDEDGGKEWLTRQNEGDAVPLQLRKTASVANDSVVFDIGDDDEDEFGETTERDGDKGRRVKDLAEENGLIGRKTSSSTSSDPPRYDK
ncbi:lung seven transmembrane receptor-domain-containing protein [Phakopsora pachyrhizi]|nr:lung seven transmembrane receptor-domain-containing protein [Phakopsora pachyrhizi]